MSRYMVAVDGPPGFYLHGAFPSGKVRSMRLPLKYHDRVAKGNRKDSCWVWTGATKGGYGIVGLRLPGGKDVHLKVHRLALLGMEEYAADGVVCHKCNNKLCCRPDHLYLGSQRSNYEDMLRSGDASKEWFESQGQPIPAMPGEKNPSAKLTWDDARKIRRLYAAGGKSQYQIAGMFNVHQYTVWAIVNNRTWKEEGGCR